jgi:small-conductance mechanosensitive channel
LSVLGISITPLITALGVGGLAVALALQDTLANLFAGIHILMEKAIRVGDFVRLETGQEGYVDDITWRTTRIRMLPNNVVVIPNSKLAQSVVTNYYLPEKRMSLLIPISVSYSSDPEQIERILVEEAKKGAADIPGLLGDPEPFVRFIPGFGDSSLDFTSSANCEFTDQYLAQHELRKRIFKRFQAEGVEIPFRTGRSICGRKRMGTNERPLRVQTVHNAAESNGKKSTESPRVQGRALDCQREVHIASYLPILIERTHPRIHQRFFPLGRREP